MSCNVAFIGLGVMGYPMAGYISKAGHNVTVYKSQVAINKYSEAISKFKSFSLVIYSWNWSANLVIEISSRSTFCALAKSKSTSKGPL